MTYTLEALRSEDFNVTGFWFNPNIHPFLEYKKRHHETERFCRLMDCELVENDRYELESFLQKILNRSGGTVLCDICYEIRLRQSAKYALENGFDSFTTTLLYSKYQRHEEIREIGDSLASEFGIEFLYRDFREGWGKGLDISRKHKLYRQQYCGCIFSEYERYRTGAEQILKQFEWFPRRKDSIESSD